MLRSLMIAAMMLVALSSTAHALTCQQVKEKVELYGEDLVVWWAKTHGYSERRIAIIKRNCLKVSR